MKSLFLPFYLFFLRNRRNLGLIIVRAWLRLIKTKCFTVWHFILHSCHHSTFVLFPGSVRVKSRLSAVTLNFLAFLTRVHVSFFPCLYWSYDLTYERVIGRLQRQIVTLPWWYAASRGSCRIIQLLCFSWSLVHGICYSSEVWSPPLLLAPNLALLCLIK